MILVSKTFQQYNQNAWSKSVTCFIEADCDYGFLALGQSCVKFVNRRVSHKFANNICKMENSRLVTINDETTASFMNSFPPSWIGKVN